MSIEVTIRPRGDTSSAGDRREIAQGTGAIDTPAEAGVALGMIANTNNVIWVQGDSQPYDVARLTQIISGAGAADTAQRCPADSRRIGAIGTSERIPPQSTFTLFIDGNPARFYDTLHTGTALVSQMTLVGDRRPDICVPAEGLQEGTHQVQFRFNRPNQAPVHITQNVSFVGMATITNAAAQPPSSGASFAREQIRVRFNTSAPGEHRVRVSVGNHVETITVPAGAAGREYTATLSGEPRSWTDTGGVPDRRTRRYTVQVSVTPLGTGDRAGTPVQAGTVTISQPAARRSGPPAPTRPAGPPRL